MMAALRFSLALVCIWVLAACEGASTDVDAATPGDDAATPAADAAMMMMADTGVGGGVDAASGDDAGMMGCAYPMGAVEPMELGAVIRPYRWPASLDGSGTNVPIDLEAMPCSADANIDWSPFDILVFIAIPAW